MVGYEIRMRGFGSSLFSKDFLLLLLKTDTMKDFIRTGWWAPTLTTTEDPQLKVIEIDNGLSWTIKFYVYDTLIDCINMESLNLERTLTIFGSMVGSSLLKLKMME
jgi:hypothetical protein